MSLVTLSSLAVPRLSAEEAASPAPPCFELRTYFAAEGKLDALNDRFRARMSHLFVRHGMTNVGYWMPLENPLRKLNYLLIHATPAAQAVSFASFRKAPRWLKVLAESESAAGGPLTAPGGVKTELLIATDCSPMK